MATRVPDVAGDAERDAAGPRSLMRLLRLFAVLARAPRGLPLSELNVALDTPKSSLLNLLRPLVAEGYLTHAGGSYRLGPSIYRLSAGVAAAWNFSKTVRPFMEELAQRTGETVVLGVMNKDAAAVTYIELIDSPHPVRYRAAPGTTAPLYASTGGRLLLAHADPAWAEDYVASVALNAKTARPVGRAWLRKELGRIRAEGLSWSMDTLIVGLSAIAAPVFDRDGHCVATLAIAGPTERFRVDFEGLKAALQDAAARASGVVGMGTPPIAPR